MIPKSISLSRKVIALNDALLLVPLYPFIVDPTRSLEVFKKKQEPSFRELCKH
jgi:hypothetical protein